MFAIFVFGFILFCFFFEKGYKRKKSKNVTLDYIETINIHETVVEDPSIFNTVEEQALYYQGFLNHDIQESIWGSPKIRDSDYQIYITLDHFKPKLSLLSEIPEPVLIVPQSNVNVKKEERIIRKNEEEYRFRLALRRSLISIV